MSKINDGGPAFPCAWENDGDMNATAPNGRVVPPGGTEIMQGMTLRDYFAAKAMQIVGCPPNRVGDAENKRDLQHWSERCYALADAMIRARGQS